MAYEHGERLNAGSLIDVTGDCLVSLDAEKKLFSMKYKTIIPKICVIGRGVIMMRIVNLGRTGLFVAMRGGVMTSLGGRSHWRSVEDVRHAAMAENIPVSDLVVRTLP